MSTVQSWLFPQSLSYISGFTTSPYVNMGHIKHVALSDSALGVRKVAAGTDHPVVAGPGTKSQAWKATYPTGSYDPASGAVKGGFGFYMDGPASYSSLLSSAKEVIASYSVRFETGWQWNKGGKLPGMCEWHKTRLIANFAESPTRRWCGRFGIRVHWRTSK